MSAEISEALRAGANKAIKGGPDRVVIDGEGYAINWVRAMNECGVHADIIFIRDDGWSLGAPHDLESVAYNLWKDKWIGFVLRPSTDPQPISEYHMRKL